MRCPCMHMHAAFAVNLLRQLAKWNVCVWAFARFRLLLNALLWLFLLLPFSLTLRKVQRHQQQFLPFARGALRFHWSNQIAVCVRVCAVCVFATCTSRVLHLTTILSLLVTAKHFFLLFSHFFLCFFYLCGGCVLCKCCWTISAIASIKRKK